MIEKIVVPLDGSVTAEAVLPHVRRLLRLEDAEVVFVRAENPAPVENYVPVAEAALAAAREYVAGIRERFEKEGAKAKGVARLGSPSSVILETIREEKATLVAMATHGRTGVRRLLFGSVAEHVLRKSPVPVLAVRPFWSYELSRQDRGIRTILVPLDGSATSRAVLPTVAAFGRLFDARAILLRALEEDADPKAAEADLREAAARLKKSGVDAVTALEEGLPGKLIQAAAKKSGADLVAMSTHGRSGVRRMLTGSVTEEVLRETKVPMLIVRAGPARKSPGKKAVASGKGKK
jgi:nucleotide-binding universal stress UspA family protein